MSTSPERPRVRGKSPAFTALTSAFENRSIRNLSTPPPAIKKLFPKSGAPDSWNPQSKQSAISALSSSFEGPMKNMIPKSVKGIENTTLLPLPFDGEQNLHLSSLFFSFKNKRES
jgi:gelsolin